MYSICGAPNKVCMVLRTKIQKRKAYELHSICGRRFCQKKARFFPDNAHTGRPRVGVRGKVRVRNMFYGVLSKTFLVILEPHAVHTPFRFFHTIPYMFIYMPCIGGSTDSEENTNSLSDELETSFSAW